MKCPKCGSMNGPGYSRCRLCGEPAPHEHTGAPGSRVCARCGQPLDAEAEICNACTRPVKDVILSNLPDVASPTECVHWSEKPSAAGRSARVVMAGILILMAGVLGIGQAAVALSPSLSETLVSAIDSVLPWSGTMGSWVEDYFVLQAWTFIAGLLAIFGGVFALTETRYEFAVMGGVFGVLAIGFLMGAFLGLIGLLLLAVSRKDFLPEC